MYNINVQDWRFKSETETEEEDEFSEIRFGLVYKKLTGNVAHSNVKEEFSFLFWTSFLIVFL